MREIGRHHRRRAAKKPERIRRHKLVAERQKLADPLGVGFRQNGDGVAIQGAMEFRMRFARDARSQVSALLVSLCAALQSCSHGEKSLKDKRGPAQICRPSRLPAIHPEPAKIQLRPGVGNRSGAPQDESGRQPPGVRNSSPPRKPMPLNSEVYGLA
jgi:hypothetical protein